MSSNQLIKAIHIEVRDNTLRSEFKLLKTYGKTAREAIRLLSEKPLSSVNGDQYYLSEKRIESIVYQKDDNGKS